MGRLFTSTTDHQTHRKTKDQKVVSYDIDAFQAYLVETKLSEGPLSSKASAAIMTASDKTLKISGLYQKHTKKNQKQLKGEKHITQVVLHFINASFRFNERKKKQPQTLQLHTIILVNENHKSNTKGKKKLRDGKQLADYRKRVWRWRQEKPLIRGLINDPDICTITSLS